MSENKLEPGRGYPAFSYNQLLGGKSYHRVHQSVSKLKILYRCFS